MRWLVVIVAAVGCGHSAGTTDGNTGDDVNGDGGVDGMVGEDAVIVPSCPTGQWCQETPPIGTGLLAAVSAANINEVFAVGDSGTILHRHANAWAAMTSNTTANLRGVWAISATNVWAAGSSGTIVHYDGSTWTVIAVPGVSSDLTGVWGSGASDVWIVGSSIAAHWNGATWSPLNGLGGILLGVSGTAAADVWACGETAYVRHYTNAWSSPISPIAGTATYYAIAASGTNVWVTSANPGKETLVYSGSTWVEHGTGSIVFQALYMPAADEVWAVGGTKVGHWGGASWNISQPMPVTTSLYGVTGSASDVFVVGAGAMILHRD